MKRKYGGEFTSELIRYPGKGGWTFAIVPEEFAPRVTHAWGRTPVRATLDGVSWDTSVWREKSGRTLLPIPMKVRGPSDDKERVRVRIEFNAL